jgi:predicted transcriptional regulator
MSLPPEEQDRFVMFHQTRDLETLLDAVAKRDLQLRDLSVLVALVAHMDRSGRVRVTGAALAEKLDINHSTCISSMTRLRQQQVIARVFDKASGERYFLVNPFIFSVGGPQRRNHLWAQFKAAVED